MDVVWAAVSLSPPTHPRNVLFAEKLAMAQWHNVQARARKLPTKQWRELEINMVPGAR